MKKKKVVVLSALAVMGISRISAGVGIKRCSEKKEDVGGLTLTGNESIELSKPKFLQNADGTITQTVHYTLHPESIQGATFYTALGWVQTNSDYYDWKTVDNTKEIEDYVTYKRNEASQTISFTCKQAFGRQRRFEMALQDDTSKTAQIFLDYKRKRLEKATVTRNVTEFTNDKPVYVKVNPAKYSIGTTGETKEVTKLDVYYKGTSIAALLGTIDEPTSSTSITYQGASYSNATDLRKAIAASYLSYLKDCISNDNPSCFQKEYFKELGKYTYTHFGTRNTRANFITNYRAAFSTGNTGFYAKVTVAGEVIYDSGINFSNSPNRLDSFSFDQSGVTF